MNVVTTFYEKKREKQIKYERSVLREISIKNLRESVQKFLTGLSFSSGLLFHEGMEEACYDVAIEAYLLGAHFSRFGYFGEPVDCVKKRCEDEEKQLIDTLYNFILYWGEGQEGKYHESLYHMCREYIEVWWFEGYRNGEKRHKLRLH